jgi:hypothetical protein
MPYSLPAGSRGTSQSGSYAWNRNGRTFARRGWSVGWQIMSARASHVSIQRRELSASGWFRSPSTLIASL